MMKNVFAAGLLATTAFGASSALAQDAALVEEGANVFKRCAACHQIGADAENGVGPMLTGVIGRTAGTLEDYTYSDAMIAAGEEGLVWDDETLAAYLEAPKEMVKGTKMAFAGLRKEEQRLAVIEYIKSESGEPAS